MRVIASFGAGFLLAVLWMDLMFDVQVLRHPGADLPATVLASLSSYYARVTTAARPMNRLVAFVMLVTVLALGVELARSDLESWRVGASLVLAVIAVGLAAGRTVRNAVRLGRAVDDAPGQSLLARSILGDHLVCLGAIAGVLVLQLLPA